MSNVQPPTDVVRPFTINVDDAVLVDLRNRLTDTRWPDAEVVDDWSQGVPLHYLQDVCAYWADPDQYRWRDPVRGRSRRRLPRDRPVPAGLRLLRQTDESGWGVEKIGELWTELLARLGYDRYVAQGGDWGSAVTSALAAHDPDHCAAIHLTLALSARPTGEPATPEEHHALARIKHYRDWDSGYSTQQRTRPQTVGYGLHDSPSGQAAWILEKFWAWTDCDGHSENVLGRDELLDNIMLYWVTGSATSSARIYWESFGRAKRPTVPVPTGFAVYPREIVPSVRRWVEALYPNLVHWSEHDRGGTFRRLRGARHVRRRHPGVFPTLPLMSMTAASPGPRSGTMRGDELRWHAFILARGRVVPRSARRRG